MSGEVTDAVIFFGAGVDDGSRMVREAGKMSAVFLREEDFDLLAFFGVIEYEGVVRACGKAELARVVEVEGGDRSFGFVEFELLQFLVL